MRRRSRSGLFIAAGLSAAVLTSACSGPVTQPTPTAATDAFREVRNLEVDPESGALLVATSGGMFQLEETADGVEVRGPVGGLDLDAKGFTLSNGVAYASGHPGPNTPDKFGSPHLGLIRSHDKGQNWVNVSLIGVTDLHDLTLNPGHHKRIYAVDAISGTVRKSDDGQIWTDGANLAAVDILAPDENPDILYATAEDGLFVSTDGAKSFTLDLLAPHLSLIASGADNWLVGIDINGVIWYQELDGGPWSQGGFAVGEPQALAVDTVNGRVIVGDDRGIAATSDYGNTWEVLWSAD